MPKAIAVIGAAFGDCGKGLLTDYFSDEDTVVCRFNGGSQAGHTVVRAGKRHVFRHFGSGSLRNASTFLSRFFINNPILFLQELKQLQAIGCLVPRVLVDPLAPVTTPVDMMINQMVEETRGDHRHGSCGVGINETIKRSEAGFEITVGTLMNWNYGFFRESMMDKILNWWVPRRLTELGIELSDVWKARLYSRAIHEKFYEMCDAFLDAVVVSSIPSDKKIVFEGAQGLLLDEDHYWFPHVTHSHTGLHNVMQLASEIGLEQLDVVYVTRAYATRHGAGPFPREVTDLHYEDATNVHNTWQGTLRFGHLDLDLLAESITDDLGRATLPCRHGLAVTCLDQVGDTVAYWQNGVLQHTSATEMVTRAYAAVDAQFGLMSYGPTADQIELGHLGG